MKTLGFIVLFLGIVIVGFVFYIQHLDLSYTNQESGIFFFYPPFLTIQSSDAKNEGLGQIVLVQTKPIIKEAIGKEKGVSPIITISVTSKNETLDLERWLTTSRNHVWSGSKNTRRAEINGRKAVSFDVSNRAFPTRVTVIDFGTKAAFIIGEYEAITDSMYLAGQRIAASFDIKKFK